VVGCCECSDEPSGSETRELVNGHKSQLLCTVRSQLSFFHFYSTLIDRQSSEINGPLQFLGARLYLFSF
jgi:hypothetical protein